MAEQENHLLNLRREKEEKTLWRSFADFSRSLKKPKSIGFEVSSLRHKGHHTRVYAERKKTTRVRKFRPSIHPSIRHQLASVCHVNKLRSVTFLAGLAYFDVSTPFGFEDLRGGDTATWIRI